VIWYRAEIGGRPPIKEVEVSRFTEKSVQVAGVRYLRKAVRVSHFETWEQARDWLVLYAQREVDYARRQLERDNGLLGNMKGLKKP
jgi:hypothetical protein